ncbi:type II toxin-antitoxin system RelE/ParE family toxin [Spirosoma linguale]|uniref:type II toxin-antitoxin system RelE/ParE family toxin n=1 Tax=Spirosoma linguale TaxID=108 RepID=UPI003CC7FA72
MPCIDSVNKSNQILDQLDAVTSAGDIQQMGSGIHKLTGDRAEFWSIKVSPSYRIIFRFADGDVQNVDYIDYH